VVADPRGPYVGRAGQTMVLVTPNVRLRIAPGLRTATRTVLAGGTTVLVEAVQRDWDRVRVLAALPSQGSRSVASLGAEGWVYSHYLQDGTATTIVAGFHTGQSAGAGQWVRVTAPVLRVRAAPGLTAPVVGRLSRGTTVLAVSTRSGWREVLWQASHRGWVFGAYVQPVPSPS
jgi:hypothetical protein